MSTWSPDNQTIGSLLGGNRFSPERLVGWHSGWPDRLSGGMKTVAS